MRALGLVALLAMGCATVEAPSAPTTEPFRPAEPTRGPAGLTTHEAAVLARGPAPLTLSVAAEMMATEPGFQVLADVGTLREHNLLAPLLEGPFARVQAKVRRAVAESSVDAQAVVDGFGLWTRNPGGLDETQHLMLTASRVDAASLLAFVEALSSGEARTPHDPQGLMMLSAPLTPEQRSGLIETLVARRPESRHLPLGEHADLLASDRNGWLRIVYAWPGGALVLFRPSEAGDLVHAAVPHVHEAIVQLDRAVSRATGAPSFHFRQPSVEGATFRVRAEVSYETRLTVELPATFLGGAERVGVLVRHQEEWLPRFFEELREGKQLREQPALTRAIIEAGDSVELSEGSGTMVISGEVDVDRVADALREMR